MKILKLKDLITLQNILFVKDSLTNEGMSLNEIFQQSTTTHYQNTAQDQLASSFRLRKCDFKTEREIWMVFYIANI